MIKQLTMCAAMRRPRVPVDADFMLSKKRVNKFLGFFTFKFFFVHFPSFFKVHHKDYIRGVNYKLNVSGA